MRKIFIIFCCGLLLFTCGCGQKDEVMPTVNAIKTASEIKKTEEQKPPSEIKPTETSSATSTTTTTEKEKEIIFEPTCSTESKPSTTPPKTDTTVTEKPNPTQNISSVVDKTEAPPAEEIYNTQPYVDTADIEKLVVKYINGHRVAQGDMAATLLTGLTEVARYRAKQLVTNFSHHSIPDACTELKYGEYVDISMYEGCDESDNYYRGYNREAIGMGGWCGTADQMAHRIADGFRNSKNHTDFIIQAIEAEHFMVGDVVCPLKIEDKEELESINLKGRKSHLQWLNVIKKVLDVLGVTCELDIDSMTDDDTKMLVKLARSILQKEFVKWDLNDNHFPEINIANIIVKLCVLEHEEDKTLCKLFPYTNAPIGYHLKYVSGGIADTSYHILLKKDSMLRCCNINFAQLVEQMKGYSITEELSGSLVWLLLEMLAAYDESQDERKDILDAAIEFATWLRNTDKFTPQDLLDLNYCQTVARLKSLSDNDIKTLHSIIEASPTRKDVYVGTYLLLEDYVSAKNHYDAMEDEERTVFDSYPISRFWHKI